MNKILLLFVLFFALKAWSQPPENTTTKISNSTSIQINSTTNSTNSNNFSVPIVTDSILNVSDKNQETDIKIVKKNSSVQSKKEVDIESSSIQQKQAISTEFSKAKVSSSYQRTQRTPTPQMQQQMDEKVQEIKEQDPNSFEYNLFYYSSGNYDVKREESLKKAEKIQPTNSEVLKQCAANSIVKADTVNARKYLNQLEFQQVIQAETIDYTKDVLISTSGNSTLITHGFNDSYGALQNQMNHSVETKVDVISLDFLQSQSYRDVLTKKGYDVPKQKVVNVDYLKSFCELNASKNISLSMTIPREYFEPIKSKLYPSGLVFEYRENPKQTSYSTLEDLWNIKLNKKVIYNYQSGLSNSYAVNYLPTLIYLKEYYEQNGDTKNLQKIEGDLQRVGMKSGKLNYLKKKN